LQRLLIRAADLHFQFLALGSETGLLNLSLRREAPRFFTLLG
jgi:hypothetical protein